MSPLTCAISIATRNRSAELRRTLAVLVRLDPPPDEIVICADGCTDHTADIVREQCPGARIFVHEKSRGSIASRDELIRQARSDIVVSFDDDSYPLQTDFIARVRELFEKMPRLAVASFSQRSDEFPDTLTREDFGPSCFVGNYVNAAAAFRRSVYLQFEGWQTLFGHAYDESDYSLQCLAAGQQVFHAADILIRHHYSAQNRSEMRVHHSHARNELWDVFLRCPAAQLPAVAIFRIARQFGYARKRGWPWIWREPVWWWNAARGLPRCLTRRKPVSWRCYKNWMALARKPIFSEREWMEKFAPHDLSRARAVEPAHPEKARA